MGERKTQAEIDKIILDNNVSRVWSWSRYNTSLIDPYGYMLKYILRVKPDQIGSIYGTMGGEVHEIIESLYKGELTREEAISRYRDTAMELEILGQTFNRKDEEANERIGDRYHQCNLHFLENSKLRRGNDERLEEFIEIKVGGQLFIGYVDYSYEKDGILYIEDFKTSSIYIGKKRNENAGQLKLYALGKIQQGWDIDKIKIGWQFTKYVDVHIKNKGKGWRKSTMMRCDIGDKLATSVRSWMGYEKECAKHNVEYSESDIDRAISEMVLMNSISHLPKHIQEKFIIEDCFVEADLTQELIDELVNDMVTQVGKLIKLELEFEKTGDKNLFYQKVTDEDAYFFANLCDYSIKHHAPYRDYVNKKNEAVAVKEEDDVSINELLDELGLI
jgi:hypothetical protein